MPKPSHPDFCSSCTLRTLDVLLSLGHGLLLLALLSVCSIAQAEAVRLASWDLTSAAFPADTTKRMEVLTQSAVSLRQLSPDIILLQGVTDWSMCEQVAEALKPAEYQVVLCSAFRDPATGQPAKRQLSILTRQKPYFFWSESWTAPDGRAGSPGGFAFAALQTAGQRLGVYCVDFATEAQSAEHARQLLEHIERVKKWEANPVQTVFLGGTFAASGKGRSVPQGVVLLQDNGLADACFDLPPTQRKGGSLRRGANGTTTWLLAERSAFGVNPQEIAVSGNLFVSCDLELDAAKVAAGWPARAQESERRSLAKTEDENALAPGGPGKASPLIIPQTWWLVLLAASGISVVFLFVRARRTHRTLALPPHEQAALLPPAESALSGISSFNIVVSPEPPGKARSSETIKPSSFLHQERAGFGQGSAITASPPQVIPIDEAGRKHLLAELGGWLKRKFVRRLVADRQKLLDAQETAVLKAQAVDERLSRIEQQIQQQTRTYELRIEELTLELIAAKEENRELIRARIAQVKLEMASVRAKVLARAQAQPGE